METYPIGKKKKVDGEERAKYITGDTIGSKTSNKAYRINTSQRSSPWTKLGGAEKGGTKVRNARLGVRRLVRGEWGNYRQSLPWTKGDGLREELKEEDKGN